MPESTWLRRQECSLKAVTDAFKLFKIKTNEAPYRTPYKSDSGERRPEKAVQKAENAEADVAGT